ncbi:hypothetical protein ABB37_07922 [Leptomonas pyrrhocoris]|uniref:Secreted protein n=1 Tax=Leptomonas pyrrhocoris TaxID=157538 RepID=A0A0M9FU62_LEPPY|nr:hypothetical protein ABB37_07922 [Leptomonas pyrrhocoris]KPA76160.1 hypothetical protein ABB37_07922 [Leptomonas pyrrhocoris]|eukprot:XP_015654599.1 hypothetical protein ABB37_07922 [Leptomonas pyrrhocoris]
MLCFSLFYLFAIYTCLTTITRVQTVHTPPPRRVMDRTHSCLVPPSYPVQARQKKNHYTQQRPMMIFKAAFSGFFLYYLCWLRG